MMSGIGGRFRERYVSYSSKFKPCYRAVVVLPFKTTVNYGGNFCGAEEHRMMIRTRAFTARCELHSSQATGHARGGDCRVPS
jgi:hypothetical protein